MAHVSVTIAGRPYRMACAEGDEARLTDLAAKVDARIVEMRGSFGEIGDQRLTVMAAVTFADETAEAKAKVASLEAELARGRAGAEEARAALETARDRVERVAASLNQGVRTED
ncbi:MAG: cell division protein ZapA [Hyphomicrobiales bacterium]|nr:cell division protein ZapA [Hyphomicrobiales bacterium]MDE2017679.1 cell division protein ZapA [Hyphomicrobiales bacterium]